MEEARLEEVHLQGVRLQGAHLGDARWTDDHGMERDPGNQSRLETGLPMHRGPGECHSKKIQQHPRLKQLVRIAAVR